MIGKFVSKYVYMDTKIQVWYKNCKTVILLLWNLKEKRGQYVLIQTQYPQLVLLEHQALLQPVSVQDFGGSSKPGASNTNDEKKVTTEIDE